MKAFIVGEKSFITGCQHIQHVCAKDTIGSGKLIVQQMLLLYLLIQYNHNLKYTYSTSMQRSRKKLFKIIYTIH